MSLFKEFNNPDAVTHLLLTELGIRVDADKIIAEFEKHPDYPNLMAVGDVLKSFNAPNDAYHVPFDELGMVPCPFIAHAPIKRDDFVVVHSFGADGAIVSNNLWNRKQISAEEIKKIYQGVVLVAEKGHRQMPGADLSKKLSKWRVPAGIIGLALILALSVALYTPWLSGLSLATELLTLVKTIGLLTAILLLVQSIDSNNPLVQAICGGGKTNCNAILGSHAANIPIAIGIRISWSELGFFYFAGTWASLLFCGTNAATFYLLTLFNLLCLPYTVYSIYYQARIAKQWCKLCCLVQATFWAEFGLFIFAFQAHIPSMPPWSGMSGFIICLALPVLLWLALKPLLMQKQRVTFLQRQLHSFKYDPKLFNSILTAQPRYALPAEEWSIVLGNPEAKNVITVVSYPYCPPCSGVHKQVDDWLEQDPELQVRIILTTRQNDDEQRAATGRHLMALNALHDKNVIKNALHDWYNQKQKSYADWAKKYPVHLNGAEYQKMEAQNEWCKMTDINDTPTILVNGYFLPRMYQLPDIKYML